jgi:hypothetical protein
MWRVNVLAKMDLADVYPTGLGQKNNLFTPRVLPATETMGRHMTKLEQTAVGNWFQIWNRNNMSILLNR